ncbi:family 20 glycosylhydrolase [Hufsiella ginkgonis]|uniref:beta-N-acetylhexosaminidase n=1 Tax=Hufsiella ginkgonis TaxID=2695274 RepID=A0A7K1XZL0_9SPHI|nr:family 20 glycosylhydrolase [Hufsiella ginkgonis]MXV16455.1 family 20 glycosylhydrolase [Hufsiella ginkgonis]
MNRNFSSRKSLKKFFLAPVLLMLLGSAGKSQVKLIPEPVKVTEHPGRFTLPRQITIQAAGTGIAPVTSFLGQKLAVATGYTVKTTGKPSAATIRLILTTKNDPEIGKEGYHLTSSAAGIIIRANQPAGLFYGAQTLVQLLPAEIESHDPVNTVRWTVPHVSITDYPRFEWRGLMFDVARHFFSVQDVKAYIDQMSRYKLNLFHWHLTDDEGWRIEIKSLPNLTKKGAWNIPKVGKFGNFAPSEPGTPRTQGGFYTQEEIREVVKYAQDRFINVLPEVDVPGHSLAAVASYPEISCTPDAVNYQVSSGDANFMDWKPDGIIASIDNTICPANEKAYEFLDKVFSEMAPLFPFGYIHVGGDECAKNFWEKSDAVKALMQREGLKSMHEVQSYFEKRVSAIVNSKGKKLIGWDEILEGGLAPGAAVMSWRGEKGGVEASILKHDVVMSPTSFGYLDYMQGDPATEPLIYASLRLEKAYKFEPVPAGADAKYIKGGQANLWTEQVYNLRHAQYMTWPRAFALSESVWSPKEKKSWKSFIPRVEQQFARFDAAEVKYSPAMYDPVIRSEVNPSGDLNIVLRTEIDGLDIYYSFDNTYPDRFYPKYTSPVVPPKDATQMRMITYRGKKPIGRMMTIPVKDLRTRAANREPRFRVLVLAENGGHHEAYSARAKEYLNKLGADSSFSFVFIRNTKPVTEDYLKQFQLFIQLDYPPYAWTDSAATAFQKYVTEGRGGWIGFHHATLLGEFDGYPMWKWFSGFMGDITYKNYIATFAAATVKNEAKDHPVMKGIPPSFPVRKEEWYTYNKSPRPNVTVLASVNEATYVPDSKIKMGDHPVIWTNPNVAARNVYIFMGHSPDLFDNPDYLTLFKNAISWASKK